MEYHRIKAEVAAIIKQAREDVAMGRRAMALDLLKGAMAEARFQNHRQPLLDWHSRLAGAAGVPPDGGFDPDGPAIVSLRDEALAVQLQPVAGAPLTVVSFERDIAESEKDDALSAVLRDALHSPFLQTLEDLEAVDWISARQVIIG